MFASNAKISLQPIPNDLNASFTSEGTEHSYDSDSSTSHIYNELLFITQQQNAAAQQSSTATAPLPIQQANIHASNGIIYGFRTRHLSCIEEGDSDSLHSSSIPKPYDMMKDADETFKKIINDEKNHHAALKTWNETGENQEDDIFMIDESQMNDEQYMQQLSEAQAEQCWLDAAHTAPPLPQGMPPDIMTTSCYGALNNSFGSETSGPPGYMETSTPIKMKLLSDAEKRCEAIYATPDKRREANRSFDSSCASQASSIYGGLEQAYSMTTSLDLKCMSGSTFGTLRSGMDLSITSNEGVSKMEWPINANGTLVNGTIINAVDDLNEEIASKCISAAENGK